MPHRLFDGNRVVARDPGKAEPFDRRVDQHRRQAAGRQSGVVVVGCVLLGIEPAGEHDARDLLLQEQVDVVGLRDPAGRLRAEHRREALLGEGAADHLGERREDRVLQLRQDESDKTGPLAAQLRRSFVAEDVEGGEDCLAGCLGDAGLAVQHSADGRLTDADLARDLGEPSGHAAILREFAQVLASKSTRPPGNRTATFVLSRGRVAPGILSADPTRCPHPQLRWCP